MKKLSGEGRGLSRLAAQRSLKMSKQFLPSLLCLIDGVECLVCAFHRDWPRTLYWFAAALITFSTTLKWNA